ncbi:MAG: hypothetical protein ACRENE_01415, partial [Polyangiaceae bacterium]
PYDAAKGRDAGFDDFADKPFDTQGLLDKVKKAISAREGMKAAAPAPAAPPQQAPAPAAAFSRAPAVPVASPAPPVVSQKPQQPWPTQRTHTLTFEGGMPPAASPPAPAAAFAPPMSHIPQRAPQAAPSPAGLPIVTAAKPAPSPAAPAVVARPAPAAAHMAPTAPPGAVESVAAAAVNGQLAGKLGGLGLNPQQVEAVLALSREVVERVVWEVVPQLAETIIKEEIKRLTKE